MSSPEEGVKTSRCHVVAVPYPGRGHINPMMNLCKSLVSRIDINNVDILVTFVVTEEWLGFLGSEAKPDSIRFATIPNVLPSELIRGTNFPGFFAATQTKMEEPVAKLLDRLDFPADVIIADTCLPWALDVGYHRNIPVASLWIMSATVFSIFYHVDLLAQNHHFPFEVSEKGEEIVDYIPGLSSFRLADLPTVLHGQGLKIWQSWGSKLTDLNKANYILLASIYDHESSVVDALKREISVPLYTFGPLIPPCSIQENTIKNPNNNNPSELEYYLKWLDRQPQASVLYIALGSFLLVSNSQMDEIAAGLNRSGVRFLWVSRAAASGFVDNDGESRSGENEMGIVVPWCDQLRVLSHSSVGGFWSHCGWNSIQEAVFEGVPLLTFPLTMDQVPNSKLIVDDWKIGRRVKKTEVGSEHLVNREEIAEIVKKFMNLESDERKEMVIRAKSLQESCRRQLREDGLFQTNLRSFMKEILR